MDWSNCPDAERIPGKVSGVWLVKGTRIPVQAVIDNADDFTPEQIAADIYDGLPVDRARRIIAFAIARPPFAACRSKATRRLQAHARENRRRSESSILPHPLCPQGPRTLTHRAIEKAVETVIKARDRPHS